jgi:hypothetical protein
LMPISWQRRVSQCVSISLIVASNYGDLLYFTAG